MIKMLSVSLLINNVKKNTQAVVVVPCVPSNNDEMGAYHTFFNLCSHGIILLSIC